MKKERPLRELYRCGHNGGLEVELRRNLQQAPTKLLGSRTKAREWIIGCRGWRCVYRGIAQQECRLRRITRAEAIQRMVEEVEPGDAKPQVSAFSHGEASLHGEVGIEKRRAVRV